MPTSPKNASSASKSLRMRHAVPRPLTCCRNRRNLQLLLADRGSSPHACAPSNSYGLMPSEATGADAVACSSLQPRCGGGWPAEQRFVQQQDSKEDLLWQRCYVRGIPRLTAELRGTYLGRGVNECFEQERNTQAELTFSAFCLVHRSIYISRLEPKARRALTKSEYAAAVNKARTPAAAALTVSDSKDGCTA